MKTTDQEWAQEQFEGITPTQAAVRAFDASEAGQRYLRITGVSMWTNLGGNTLPHDYEGDEVDKCVEMLENAGYEVTVTE